MYMFFWFFKQLYYILKRFTKHKFLLLLVFFVIAFFLFIKPIFAFNQYDLHFSGFSSTQQTDIYNFIQANKGDYDSVLVRYYWSNPANFGNPEYRISFSFYNYADLGKLYKTLGGSGSGFNYVIKSQYTKTNSVHYIGVDYNNFSNILSESYQNTINIGVRDYSTGTNNNINNTSLFATNRDIYSDNNYNDVWFTGSNIPLNSPYITNPSSSIIDFSFNTLTINAGSLPYNDYYELTFYYPNNSTSYTGSINNYKTQSNGTLYFNIPREWITSDIVVRDGTRISFDLYKYHRQEPAVTSEHYNLGYYDIVLTEEQETIINEDSNKQLLSDINKTQQQTNDKLDQLNSTQQETNNKLDDLNTSQQETTNAVNNLNNTITDSNIDNSSINLPSDNSTDITQEGLNGIFTSIYNAFCTGQAQDIIFPIPFTNKNITLQANYVRNMLSNNGATWVITLIEAFWWYLISRFIIKDITNKITKIKSGNIEDIEDSNIKGDML